MMMNNAVVKTFYWDDVSRHKEWNRVCHGYPTKENFYNFTEEIPDLNKDMRVLDFGCGPGRVVKTIAPNVKEYVGVDVCAGFIAMAKEHHKDYKNVSFYQCNGRDLKMFEDNSFDYLYERLVFIHVPKEWIIGYVVEFHRVLKSGGILNIPDFPRDDQNTNGFSVDEMNTLLKDFAVINFCNLGNTYVVRCIK